MRPPLHLLVLLGLLLSARCLTTVHADGAPRPNILYLYVDDLGWGSIGPNGQAERAAAGQPHVLTPNLDRLASEGINFVRGYGCPVCSPARSSQQSGFHQGHTFADRNDPDNAKKAMRADEVLIGDALSAAGYATGYWGKWGFGGSKDLKEPKIVNVQTLPTSHGYQHVLAELHHVRAHTFFQPTLWKAPAADRPSGLRLVRNTMSPYRGRSEYPDRPARQNHAGYPSTGYCDDAYCFAAMEFVRAQANRFKQTGQPFFGLLAVQIPHAPFGEIGELPDWDEAYRSQTWFDSIPAQARHWAAMVTRIDAHFGNLMTILEQEGIADDTLVVFQSDNGGPAGQSNAVFDANGGLRGFKGSVYEGGIRVPLVMRWPSRINADSRLKAGTDSDKVVDVTDLLPTFCELAGTSIPLGIDGVSIAPTLQGVGKQRERKAIVHESKKHQSIIQGRFKLVRSGNRTSALYDLDQDRSESHDIASQKPGLVRELELRMTAERTDEPKGFAVTYHHWTGSDGGHASDPRNWSDYVYANAGVEYLSDSGAPRLSWVAELANEGDRPNTVVAGEDLAFLALAIGGDASTQTLELAPHVELTGRNEIRIDKNGRLVLNDSTVSSRRWVELNDGGVISGHGVIQGNLFAQGLLRLSLAATPTLQVTGQVQLDGKLELDGDFSGNQLTDQPVVLLTAETIEGSFSNPDQIAVTDDGSEFMIGYTKTAITLTPTGR